LRVWESMVLRTGKERANWLKCTAMIQGSIYVRWQ
jgi:hypothetical protein